MRSQSGLAAFGAALSTAVLLIALVVISPESVLAEESASRPQPFWIDPDDVAPRGTAPARVPAHPKFDDYDVIATLDAVRVALSEVGDGGTYVWHRRDGTMSGTARPTSSFKGRNGEPCRHLVVTLQSKDLSRTTEGIACRLATGRWQLDG